jgi:hypothetical protein
MSGTACGECLFHFLFDGKGGRGRRPTILKPVSQEAVEALPAQREAPLPKGLHRGWFLTSGRTRDYTRPLFLLLLLTSQSSRQSLMMGQGHPGHEQLLGQGGEGGGEKVVMAGVGE